MNEQQIETAVPEAIPVTRVVFDSDSPKLVTEWYPVLKIEGGEVGIGKKDDCPISFENYEDALEYAQKALLAVVKIIDVQEAREVLDDSDYQDRVSCNDDGYDGLYQVYYATDNLEGRYFDPERRFVIGETHKYIRTVHAKNVTEVYPLMQGHIWSPNGEARSFIEALEGVHHTSMSIGDVAVSPTGQAWMCVPAGWEKV